MRLLPLSLLIFTLVPWSVFNFVSAENQEGRFAWSESRPLQWSDFKGQPGTIPPGFERSYEIAAFTFTWNESQWRFEKTSSASCQYEITQMDVPAYFLPYSSWVKSEYEDDYFLKHEQGHFDIAEINARQFRALVGQVFPCPTGIFDVTKINAEISHKWTDNIRQLGDMNSQYDKETNGGLDKTKQAEWNTKLQSLLISNPQSYSTSNQLGTNLKCPDDYPYLHADNQCWNIPECPAGYPYYNSEDGLCYDQPPDSDLSCPDDYPYLHADNQCYNIPECPAGYPYYNSEDDLCYEQPEMASGLTCPDDYPYLWSDDYCYDQPESDYLSNGCPVGYPYLWSDDYCYDQPESDYLSNGCPVDYPYLWSDGYCYDQPESDSGTCPADYPYRHSDGQCWNIPECPPGYYYAVDGLCYPE